MARARRSVRRSAARRTLTAPAAVIGVGGLLVSGVGTAEAVTGGSFVLGKINRESSIATLVNHNGTPLSLKAKRGSPPLRVNTSTLVPRLNASRVGGVPANKLQRVVSGSCGAGLAGVTATGGVTCAHQQLVFSANGSFTVPTGVTQVTGEIWGAGGGGAINNPYGNPGGSGAEGGYERVIVTVIPGHVYDVVIGAPGARGDYYTHDDGFAGGNSIISVHAGATVAQAGGGNGGLPDCSVDVSGGLPLAPGPGVIGVEARQGDPGTCQGSPGGSPGFAGAGGVHGPSVPAAFNGGDPGQAGLVIISFAG